MAPVTSSDILTKKYIIPAAMAALLFISYYKLVREYQMPNIELFWAASFLVFLTTDVINMQPGPKIPIPILDRIYDSLFKTRNYKVKPGFAITEYVDPTSFLISYSKGQLWYNLFGYSVICCGLAYFGFRDNQYSFSLMGLYLFGKGIHYTWSALHMNTPQLVFNQKGIAVSEWGFVAWENIKFIQFRDTGSGETNATNFDIFLKTNESYKHPDYSAMIDNFDKSAKQIRNKVREFGNLEVDSV